MNYKAYSPEPDGYNVWLGERNACCVQAINAATPLTFLESHNLLRDAGRRNRCAFRFNEFVYACNGMITKHIKLVSKFNCRSNWPVKRTIALSRLLAMEEYKTGNYLIRVTCHLFAYVDGVVIDHYPPSTRKQVTHVWKVEIV